MGSVCYGIDIREKPPCITDAYSDLIPHSGRGFRFLLWREAGRSTKRREHCEKESVVFEVQEEYTLIFFSFGENVAFGLVAYLWGGKISFRPTKELSVPYWHRILPSQEAGIHLLESIRESRRSEY